MIISIYLASELNVKVPWSGMIQTNVRLNDLYALGMCMNAFQNAFCIHPVAPLCFCEEPLHFESPA